MRVVIQRVSEASVTIDGTVRAQIGKGYLLLLGCENADDSTDIEWLSKKVVNLRVFDDENGVMNRSILDIGGEILVVNDLEELFHAVLVEEKHTVGGPDEGAFVLVEEILAQQKLDVTELFHPDGFGQLAEGAVEVGVGELGLVLAQVGGGEGFFDDGEGVEGDRHVHIGVGGVEGGPDVAVGEDAHV